MGDASGEEGHCVLWRRSDGTRMRIRVDGLIPLDELQRALYSMECEEYDVPVALVKWQHVSLRHNLQLLYEILVGHGLPTFPARQEALRGWDDLHARMEPMDMVVDEATRPPPSEVMTVLPEGTVAGYPSGMQRVVADLGELVDLPEEEPTLNHLWFVNHCRFPPEALHRCHATLSMDMCDRMGQLHPRPAVRTYVLDGVSLPLLLWYRSQQTRVMPMVQEYLHLSGPTAVVRRSDRPRPTPTRPACGSSP